MNPARRLPRTLSLVLASAACLALVAGCGSSSGDSGTATTPTRAAAETCPNLYSQTWHVTVKNTLADPVTLSTSGWSCDGGKWSQTGNPGKLDQQLAAGASLRVRLELAGGFPQYAWSMRAAYPSGVDGAFSVALADDSNQYKVRVPFRASVTAGGQTSLTPPEASANDTDRVDIGTVKVDGATKTLTAGMSGEPMDAVITLATR